jgi:hypothetical protein
MDANEIREAVEADRERLESGLRAGQPPTWQCDQRTRDVWCLGRLIDERFAGLDPERRRELGWAFSRMVRSAEDPFEVAARVVRTGDAGSDVGDITKDHWTAKNHRRWG